MKRRQFIQHMTHSLGWLSAGLLTAGCSPNEVRQSIQVGRNLSEGRLDKAITSQIPVSGVPEIDRLVRDQLQELVSFLARKWGDEKTASPQEFVKYSDDFETRAIVNFETRLVRVESLNEDRAVLQKAIITTLLTPDRPDQVDLLSDQPIRGSGQPFLYPLVRDHQGQIVQFEWRATQYAQHLANNQRQTLRQRGQPDRFFVEFALSAQLDRQQQTKFADSVRRHSRTYNIRPDLIYAIMEAESSFNPYAMSHIPAYGLMQIVPTTAGRDAHELIYKRPGTPTRDYLFVPDNNIRMGVGYLSILDTRYLVRVNNPLSREYCVIAGYNTGSGNVLRAFDNDRSRAFEQINRMQPQQVYQHLVRHLPFAETRRYMQKVTEFQRKYI
ncbi:lytic transglycosylase [Thiomicrospira aerophila AL3]|uniref:Lytic transglycosylase n=1 Tax=Thiomicrospira aerophila AL3 TaxID=717772 RepID=W0DY32_9GAMM|nr:murein transglycosylase domain-containing protein [Thiomicrospira aerophila]AHF02158.1 lytic transglycosylase [Thiomicrospira aerophila AL3]